MENALFPISVAAAMPPETEPPLKYDVDLPPLVPEKPVWKKIKKLKSKDGFTIRQFFIDDDNYLQIESNDKLIHMYLKLKSEGARKREIGTVTKSTRTIEMRRMMAVHLFRNLNAYGFNDYILRHATTFDNIRLSDDVGNHWKVPVRYVREYGKYKHFKNNGGYELQRFISLEELEQFRVHNSENRRF